MRHEYVGNLLKKKKTIVLIIVTISTVLLGDVLKGDFSTELSPLTRSG